MKILHTVEFYCPSVGGAQEVVKQLSEHLALLGHDVTVATTKLPSRVNKVVNGVKIVEFDVSGNEVRGYTGKDILKYQKYLVSGDFDVIMNYAAQEWTADLMFKVIGKIKAKKILVPCGFSGLYDPLYQQYFKDLPSILRQYDASVYLSNDYRDIEFARKCKLQNIIVIPNAADEREFGTLNPKRAHEFRVKWGIKPEESLLLNVSTHTGVKGHREAIQAFKEANIRDSVLMFIGDTNINGGCYRECCKSAWLNNHKLEILGRKHKRIVVANLSREETILAFQAADLFIFLSNIECSPLVLFEAAASGTPFISSSAGNSSEIAKWTQSGFIAESKSLKTGYTSIDIESVSNLIKRFLENNKSYEKMAKLGRKNWQAKYTWEIITRQYEKLYEKH